MEEEKTVREQTAEKESENKREEEAAKNCKGNKTK